MVLQPSLTGVAVKHEQQQPGLPAAPVLQPSGPSRDLSSSAGPARTLSNRGSVAMPAEGAAAQPAAAGMPRLPPSAGFTPHAGASLDLPPGVESMLPAAQPLAVDPASLSAAAAMVRMGVPEQVSRRAQVVRWYLRPVFQPAVSPPLPQAPVVSIPGEAPQQPDLSATPPPATSPPLF